MDERGFDDLTRRFATKRPRRAVLKGLLGLGGAAAVTAVAPDRGGAAWSTLVCLPDGSDGYIQRLVPTAAVPFYVHRYGAVLPENGSCPLNPGPDTCQALCSGDLCVYLTSGDVSCAANDVVLDCLTTCNTATDCENVSGAPLCIEKVTNQYGSVYPACENPGNRCGSIPD